MRRRAAGVVASATATIATIATSVAITRQNVSLRRMRRRSTITSESSDMGILLNRCRASDAVAFCTAL